MKSTYKVNKIYRCGPHHAADVKVDHTKEMIEYLCKVLEKETIDDPNLNIERTSPHIATSHDSIMSDLFVCFFFVTWHSRARVRSIGCAPLKMRNETSVKSRDLKVGITRELWSFFDTIFFSFFIGELNGLLQEFYYKMPGYFLKFKGLFKSPYSI